MMKISGASSANVNSYPMARPFAPVTHPVVESRLGGSAQADILQFGLSPRTKRLLAAGTLALPLLGLGGANIVLQGRALRQLNGIQADFVEINRGLSSIGQDLTDMEATARGTLGHLDSIKGHLGAIEEDLDATHALSKAVLRVLEKQEKSPGIAPTTEVPSQRRMIP